MGKKIKPPAPGVWDDIITRLESLEAKVEALEGAVNAFVVVYGVRRLPLPADSGDGDSSEHP
jgi:hypothetical protein